MGYSAKIKIDTYDPRKDGTGAIYLQVIINRKKKRLDLGISWPPNKFSLVDGCKPRSKNDPDVDQYNVVIGNARAKANNIHKSYLIRSIHLTLESFIKEYRSNLNKNDFIQYFGQKSYERWNKNIISWDTYRKEKGTLKRLKQYAFHKDPANKGKPIPEKDFHAVLPFYELNSEFGINFDNFLKKNFKNEINGRWNRHKHVTTYLIIAKDIDKITFDDPYAKFTNRLVDGSWGPLDLDEMKRIVELYLDFRDNPLPPLKRKNGVNQEDTRDGLTRIEIIVTRRFLFGCNTALRISDLQELDEDKFSNGQMSITPEKTEKYGTTIDSVPLNDIARLMLDDEIEHIRKERARTSKLLRIFEQYCDQYANRVLKRIATKSKLEKNLHHHVARYTFASIMDQAGANHTGLMKYMGLRKRSTLEKYTKTNMKVIAADVQKMNDMVNLSGSFPAKTDLSD